jgi:hypothetical protein
MQSTIALLIKRSYPLLTNKKTEHSSMQGCNFALVTSKKRLGKTHLHVNSPQNVVTFE